MGNLKGVLSLVGAGLIYATFGIWIRLMSRELSTPQQMVFRYFFAAVFAAVAMLILRQKRLLGKARILPLIVFIVAFPIELYLFVIAVLEIKLATVTFAFYGASLVLSLAVGKLLFKEKLGLPKLAGLLLALLGFLLIGYPFSQFISLGFLAAAGSGLMDVVTNSARKKLGGKVDKFTLIIIQSASTMLVMAALVLAKGEYILPRVSPLILLIAVVFGILLMAVNYLLLVGFQNCDLNLGTILLSSEMMFTPIFAALVFGEIPSLQAIIGGLVIAAGIIIVNMPHSRTRAKGRLMQKGKN